MNVLSFSLVYLIPVIVYLGYWLGGIYSFTTPDRVFGNDCSGTDPAIMAQNHGFEDFGIPTEAKRWTIIKTIYWLYRK